MLTLDSHRPGTLTLTRGLVFLAPLLLAGNFVGPMFRYPDVGAAVLFPPYAALTAALVVGQRRHWIWYILTGSVAHFLGHWPAWSLSWTVFAEMANIARALSAAILLRWIFKNGSPRLDNIGEFVWCAISAGLAAPAIGATIGAASVVAHGAPVAYWHAWVAWFASNALTGLTMLPACVAAFVWLGKSHHARIERARVIETVLLALALTAACVIAGSTPASQSNLAWPVNATLPVLIWAALRFGPSGASIAMTAVTFAVIWRIDRGGGVIAPLDGDVVAVQIFVLCTAVSVLCLATVATARQRVAHLYRSLLASLEDQVAIVDAGGVVLEVNGSWRRSVETPGGRALHRVREGDSYLTICRTAAEQGDQTAASVLTGLTHVLGRQERRVVIEYEQRRGDAREWFAVTFEALEGTDGGAVITRSDVTARHTAEIEIAEQRRELSYLARIAMLGQLSGAFAHELNQPLAAILGNAEAGRRFVLRMPLDVVEVAAILRDISNDSERAAEVIRRLRALFTRGDRRMQPVDAQELVDDVLQIAGPDLMSRHVTATTVIAPDLPQFPGDRIQLQQVLLNLILNGCDAMRTTAERRLIISAGIDAGDMHIAVRDFGTGIPPEIFDRLFEPFVSTKSDGLGLGLSISSTIVAAHGGRLWAENHPGGGTTLHCALPLIAHEPTGQTDTAEVRARR